MSPLLQTRANASAFGYLSFGGAATSFESIATVTVGSGGATSAEFTSIPATYSHLQVRLLGRDTRNASGDNFSIQFNSDTNAANYVSYHWILGDGSTVSAGVVAGGVQGQIVIGEVSTAQTSANIFSAGVFDILDYANTNKYKTVRNLNGLDKNGSGALTFSSGLWMSTNAITNIKIFGNNGNWAQYSHFALYGIKAAS
jgi:hypothetical protein